MESFEMILQISIELINNACGPALLQFFDTSQINAHH